MNSHAPHSDCIIRPIYTFSPLGGGSKGRQGASVSPTSVHTAQSLPLSWAHAYCKGRGNQLSPESVSKLILRSQFFKVRGGTPRQAQPQFFSSSTRTAHMPLAVRCAPLCSGEEKPIAVWFTSEAIHDLCFQDTIRHDKRASEYQNLAGRRQAREWNSSGMLSTRSPALWLNYIRCLVHLCSAVDELSFQYF